MKQLLRTFCAIKAINFTILFSAATFYPFNNSSSLLFSHKSTWTQLLEPFVRWDAVYYFLIAKEGYNHEQMHAFYPLFPFLIRLMTYILPFRNDDINYVISGIAIANVCHLLAYLSLYFLTLQLFDSEKFAYQSAILFLVQPASIHMTTLFSEAPFAALAITGMLCFVTRYDLIAAILFFLAGIVRSNGVLLAGFFLYRVVFMFRSVKECSKYLSLSLLSASGGFIYLFGCYKKYCGDVINAEWCLRRIPNIYSYVQTKYWNVGAFKYYTLTQLPNFIIAGPMLALSFYGLVNNRDVLLFRTKQKQVIPFYYLWLSLLVFSLVFVHIQVVNRLFSFLPPVFWTLATLYENLNIKHRKILLSIVGLYYSSIGFMIACFYPPA